jgi:CubicO group peptidase (beta-lactamase class C family)
VAAWGVLRLVEQGRIGLDDPVVGHLRRWRPPPSPFQASGITVRRLLSHTAGLSVHGYTGQTPDQPLPSIAASLSGETGESFPVELLEAPGRHWQYSGGGYSILQLLTEQLTGQPFADYMQIQVLEPLGMTASSFQWQRNAATVYPHDADGDRIPTSPSPNRPPPGWSPPHRTWPASSQRRCQARVASRRDGTCSARPGYAWRSPPLRPPMAAGGSATASGSSPPATGSPTTRAPTGAGGPAWPCCPTDGQAS